MIPKQIFTQVSNKYYEVVDEFHMIMLDDFFGGADDVGDINYIDPDMADHARFLKEQALAFNSILHGCTKCKTLEQAVANYKAKHKPSKELINVLDELVKIEKNI